MRSSDGYFKLPSDYEVFSSLLRPIFTNAPECDGTPTKIWRKVEVVTEGERVERLQSRLVYPTPKKPIGCFYQGGIFVDPEGVDRVRLAYLKLPKTPVRGYTVTNNQDIYNASTSVQFDWPEIVHPDFIMRVCRYIGINLREEELVRYMLERIKSGE